MTSATTTAVDTSARVTTVVDLLTLLDAADVRFALQGARGAAARWARSTGPADLDVWVASGDRAAAADVLRALGGVPIAVADDPARLRHDVWGLVLDSGPAVVDLTIGDLRVGPVVLAEEHAIDVEPDEDPLLGVLPRLAGPALVADLLLRPLLRGRVPGHERLREAQIAWAQLDAEGRRSVVAGLGRGAGEELGLLVAAVLDGAPVPDGLATQARRLLARRTLVPSSIPSAWRQRRAIAPSRRPGPFGMRGRGSLVVLVGTDGSGKSTLAEAVTADLTSAGFRVRPQYFGMARGNLPGVATARRLLGVAPSDDGAGEPVATDRADAAAAHPRLRRIAAWYYAGEYVWRYATRVAPALARGEIVLCDRWVTDLRFGPAPGSAASRVVERLVATPDVMVLPDAPPEVIHTRKPERTEPEIAAQQALLRSVLASQPEACRTLVVDTSGADPRPHDVVVRTVVASVHRSLTDGGL